MSSIAAIALAGFAPRCSPQTTARAGGASALAGAGRVTFWGALAMAATAVVGRLFGTGAAL